MTVDFGRGMWNGNDFEQITSLRTDGRTPFIQEDDCVVNEERESEERMGNAYISLLAREWLNAPAEITAECSFVSFGAPLIVLTNDVIAAPDGYPAYGRHFEIVAYEEGLNVWQLNGTEKPLLIGKARFPVAAGEKLRLRVKVDRGSLLCDLNGETCKVMCGEMPARFRAGITACEGINRFYSFRTE